MSFLEKIKKQIGIEEENDEEITVDKSSSAKASEDKEETEERLLEPEGQLAVDVYETEDGLVIQSTIAGVKSEDLNISIENDVVTIKGTRTRPDESDEKKYFYQECYWGSFSRQIILPEEMDGSKSKASMKDGVFTLKIPKTQRRRKVKVKVN